MGTGKSRRCCVEVNLMKIVRTAVAAVAVLSALAAFAYAKPSGKAPAKGEDAPVPVYSQPFTATCKEAVNRDALIAHLESKGMKHDDAAQKAKALIDELGSYDAVQKRNCN